MLFFFKQPANFVTMNKRLFLLSLVLFLVSVPVCARPLSDDNPVAHGEVRVQSWKARRDFGIVKQNLDFSCGAASIATLLNNFYGQNLTEREILERMGKTELRASFEDMRQVMPQLGFEAKGYALPFEQLAQLKIPVIVYLKYRKNDHFSVLRGIDGDTVLLADPSLGHVSLSREQFLAAWNTRDGEMAGKILAVLPRKATVAENTAFFLRQPQRQTRLLVEQVAPWRLR